ncbi:MAG TPA: type II methionyl aminopeptidase [Methanocella sp.]|nr:type II methionyl aminopeptidase [Methanocella sp.]
MVQGITAEELRSYETAGEIVKAAKRNAAGKIRPGLRLVDLAIDIEREIIDAGAGLAFPCNISINSIASHYTPAADNSEVFRQSDVIKVDVGAIVDGFIADSAFTIEVESDKHQDLIMATENVLEIAINTVRPGAYTSEVGRAIEESAAARGYHVLKDLYGHNMGRNCLHGGLTIPGYDDRSRHKIREGDVLAIEPFLTPGIGEITRAPGGNIYMVIRRESIYARGEKGKKLLTRICREYGGFPFARRWLGDESKWLDELIESAAVMEYPMLIEKDGAPVAQAEHTVIVEHNGCRIIT